MGQLGMSARKGWCAGAPPPSQQAKAPSLNVSGGRRKRASGSQRTGFLGEQRKLRFHLDTPRPSSHLNRPAPSWRCSPVVAVLLWRGHGVARTRRAVRCAKIAVNRASRSGTGWRLVHRPHSGRHRLAEPSHLGVKRYGMTVRVSRQTGSLWSQHKWLYVCPLPAARETSHSSTCMVCAVE